MRTSYQLAEWLGYMTRGEVEAMHNLAGRLPPAARVAAIGAGAGTHTLSILEVTHDVLIFSVDIRCGEYPHLTREHITLQEAELDHLGLVWRLWMDSKIAGINCPVPLDMLFIDGDHELPGVRGDIRAWARHVKPGGVIAFHDYGSPNWPAVKIAVDDMIAGEWELLLQVDTLIAFKKVEDETQA